MTKILFIIILILYLTFLGCRGTTRSYPVDFVDRDQMFEQRQNPLRLMVEIDENGRLRLNQIETGTMEEVSLLAEKLKVIFEDREKLGIRERTVVIDQKGKINDKNLGRLIEILAKVNASPILVIKGDQ